MLQYIWRAAAIFLAYHTLAKLWNWRKLYVEAKATGITCFLVPVDIYSRTWVLWGGLYAKALHWIPQKRRPEWLERIKPMYSWSELFAAFQGTNYDSYIMVSPSRCHLMTASAEIINQITSRKEDFPKPVHLYRTVNIFGRSVLTTEGQAWRHHRKIVGPPFGERNNRLVWKESLHQAELMLKSWTGSRGESSKTITELGADTMRLSLHVISRAGFGVQLSWPGVDDSVLTSGKSDSSGPINRDGLENGHTMTYTDALSTMLHNIFLLIVVPRSLLKRLPIKRTKQAYEAFIEWGKYMNEMFQTKRLQIESGNDKGGLDLLAALIKSSGESDSSLEKGQKPGLTDDEILGNAFVFILAGHETTANTIHYALLSLAMNPAIQRRAQAEVASLFGDRPPSTWDYDADLPKLSSSIINYIIFEQLRLIPPAINVPKWTGPARQALVLDGARRTLPPDTLINLSTIGVHRNPRYFPHGPPSDPARPTHPRSNIGNDLEEFRPERWLQGDARRRSGFAAADAGVVPAAEAAPDNEGSPFFRPAKGAFVPFSDGARACTGRRFAVIEMLAVLAAVMARYSVELAVDAWASDAEVERMGPEEKREVWEKARAETTRTFRERMGATLTIQFKGGAYVPIRIVRKGEERFKF